MAMLYFPNPGFFVSDLRRRTGCGIKSDIRQMVGNNLNSRLHIFTGER
jgi:hypothetical protein